MATNKKATPATREVSPPCPPPSHAPHGNFEWSPDTEAALSNFPEDVAAMFEEGFKLKVRAKYLEDEFGVAKEKGDELIRTAYLASGNTIKSVSSPDYGTVSIVGGRNVSINRDLLISAMLEAGISADVVAAIVTKATKVKEYVQVTYRRIGGR